MNVSTLSESTLNREHAVVKLMEQVDAIRDVMLALRTYPNLRTPLVIQFLVSKAQRLQADLEELATQLAFSPVSKSW